MPQRRLLHVDANQLAAYGWQGGRLCPEGTFPASPSGVEAFAAYLKAHLHSQFYILADVAEEGFYCDTVPHVRGRDRKALLDRKLGQHFYGSHLAAAFSQGRERNGRRDERFLFAALTRPEMFEPWLACLRDAEARVAGLYSLPMVSAFLVHKIARGLERCLLISIGRGGMRQSYFEEGNLRFSRLSPLQGSGTREIASVCAAEAAKTYQYLAGQRLVPRGKAMPVLVLAPAARLGALAAACPNGEELRFEFVDLEAAARACGVRSSPPQPFSDELFLEILVRKPPRVQFAGPSERRYHRLWETRFAVVGSAAVVLLACLLFAAGQAYELVALRRATAATQALTEAEAGRHRTMTEALPQTPASVGTMRSVLARYETLEKRSASMEELMRRIAAALDRSPAVEIERIDWSLTSRAAEHPTHLFQPPSGNATDQDKGMVSAAVVSAVLFAPSADPRGMLDSINAFVAVLRRDPTLEVSVLRLPFDTEPGKYLRGGGDTPTAREQARFALRVSHKS
jgi:hypothetical protein